MSLTPQPRAGILDIAPYVGGDAKSPAADVYKLSSNENPLGASPGARAAFADCAHELALYPDGGALRLRAAIAARYGLHPDRIMCAAGSDEIFQLLGRAYLDPGDEVIQSAHGFLVYRLVAQQAGAVCLSAPERALTADVDAMLALVTPRTRLVFLANPNNPTGTYLPSSEVARLHAGLPPNVLLVLDAAYAEYVQRSDYSAGLDLASEHDNVLMTRTFSKIYGLAALRLGWAYGPQLVIDALNRVRGPFNVSSPALAAGVAALEDEEFVERSRAFNAQECERMQAAFAQLGVLAAPSVGNFVLIRLAQTGSRCAAAADAALRARGLVVRSVKAYGLDDCLRISIGPVEANTAVIETVRSVMAT
jgi:histidinol-phosphate aminotransferase